MLQNKIKYTQKLFNYLQPPGNIFIKCLATSEPLVPVNLSFTTYETTSNNSSEPPFLILHGLFGSKQNWGSLCKAYHQKANPQRKIIALDLRNHGESEHSEAHSYAHMAADLNFFLKEQNIERMALMGHSMGGRCAMLFALKYPELVEKLIIVDISPVTSSPNMDEMPMIIKMMDRIEFPENVSLSQARTIVDSQLAKNISNSNLRAFILTNIVATENKRYKWRINLPVLAKTFDHVARFPLINNNLQYTGDTLFLGGGNSNFIPKLFIKSITGTFLTKNVRGKTDLAQPENYKNIIDMAYSSFQSTESVFANGKLKEIPTPLIVLHGILGSKANFNTLSKRYHDSTTPKRLVYAVDLRNHGDSFHSRENSYDDLVMDVSKFLQTMNLKKVSLVGHDIGGRVGMVFSLKYPDLVDKLIVVDVSPITTSHNFKVIPEVLKTLNQITFSRNLPLPQAKVHVANHLARIVKNKGLMMLVLMNLVQKSDGSYSWRFNVKALLENFHALSSFPDIHNITFLGPALFIGGGKSDYIQKSDYPKIKDLFPNAELRYIDGAGHWVHSEKPNEFLKITLDFLNKPKT